MKKKKYRHHYPSVCTPSARQRPPFSRLFPRSYASPIQTQVLAPEDGKSLGLQRFQICPQIIKLICAPLAVLNTSFHFVFQ